MGKFFNLAQLSIESFRSALFLTLRVLNVASLNNVIFVIEIQWVELISGVWVGSSRVFYCFPYSTLCWESRYPENRKSRPCKERRLPWDGRNIPSEFACSGRVGFL